MCIETILANVSLLQAINTVASPADVLGVGYKRRLGNWRLILAGLIISDSEMLLSLGIVLFTPRKFIPRVVGDAITIYIAAHHHNARLAAATCR